MSHDQFNHPPSYYGLRLPVKIFQVILCGNDEYNLVRGCTVILIVLVPLPLALFSPAYLSFSEGAYFESF